MTRYLGLIILTFSTAILFSQDWQFANVSISAGLDYRHDYNITNPPMQLMLSGGSAVGDIDNDGDIDIFFVLGAIEPCAMMLNNGDGTFTDITGTSGLSEVPYLASGPLFFDYNQDTHIDLICGRSNNNPPIIYINNGDLTFTEAEQTGLEALDDVSTFTITAMDYNLDGLQDLFLSHWLEEFDANHFWKNNGDGTFTNKDIELKFYQPFDTPTVLPDYFHATNFCDINGDRYPDLLASSDFGTSQIWINENGKSFNLDTINITVDENGMGGTLGDFDNDGDMDWYVTSIYDGDGIAEGNWGLSGNKLYINDGMGNFTENALEMGAANTDWGWGVSFADLNNDGYLDVAATNGWPAVSEQFFHDHTRILLSQEGEYFIDVTDSIGLQDTLQGRGLSCIDYDQDGDLDLFITNMNGPVALWQNDLNNDHHYLSVTLREQGLNRFALGAQVRIYTGDRVQMRVVTMGSNYASQNPCELHFGLGDHPSIDSLVVTWSDGSQQNLEAVQGDQRLQITQSATSIVDIPFQRISVRPNPVFDALYISVPSIYNQHIKTIHIYDGNGLLIRNVSTSGETEMNIQDLGGLASGIYHIKLISHSGHILRSAFIKS